MKIVQVSSASSLGGGERYIVDLTNALSARGHELYAVLRPRSPLADQLRLPSERIKILPLRNALDALSARQLVHFVSQHRIDVIHAHMARDYSLAAYAAKRNPGTKFIVTRHVLFPLNRLHRRTLSLASCVIAVSEAVANQLRSQELIDNQRIAVVLNGIDLHRFENLGTPFNKQSFLHEIGLPSDAFLIGSIGELRTLKRHDDFIRAAAIVAREIPSCHFIIAGVDTSSSGEVRNGLVQLVSELGLEERVHFLGWLENAPKLLQSLDVFVSASETESFGLAIVEAMAAGTAVVATATAGAQEIIDDGKTGLRVPIGDYESLAESITTLLRDEEKRRWMGMLAREAAHERFNLERMVDAIEKIYEDATAED